MLIVVALTLDNAATIFHRNIAQIKKEKGVDGYEYSFGGHQASIPAHNNGEARLVKGYEDGVLKS